MSTPMQTQEIQTQEIQTALDKMVLDLTALGAVCPEAQFTITSGGCRFCVFLNTPHPFFDGSDFKICQADTPEEALSAAQECIAKLPDPRTTKRRAWQKKLGEVIDEGHELALPDDVMKPLHAGSQAMTDNLLEDQS